MKKVSEWIQALLWPKLKPEPDQLAPHSYLCIGGPFHNKRLTLYSPSTMVFRVRDFYGHYEGLVGSDIMKWISHEEETQC